MRGGGVVVRVQEGGPLDDVVHDLPFYTDPERSREGEEVIRLAPPVLGVDIGTTWQSTGSALLWTDDAWVGVRECETHVLESQADELDAASLADATDTAARESGATAVSIDGPQGWRDPASTCAGVGRHAELSARCPGKTGQFGVSFPGTYLRWVRLCIDVFEFRRWSGSTPSASRSAMRCRRARSWKITTLFRPSWRPSPARRSSEVQVERSRMVSRAGPFPHRQIRIASKG